MHRILVMAGMLLALFILPSPAQAQGGEAHPMLVFELAAREVSAQVLASPKVKALKGGAMVIAPMDVVPPDQQDRDVDTAAELARTKLAAAFINGAQLEVLDRVVLVKAMQELKLDAKGLADPANWPVLAQQTGAQYLLLGMLTVGGVDLFSLDARLVDLGSKRALGAGGVLASVKGGVVTPAAGVQTPDLLVVAEWTLPGFAEGQLIEPTGLAVDQAGNIFVTEARRGVVQKFDPKGNLLQEWGTEAGAGKLQHPTGVAVDPQGGIYVTDFLNPGARILVYSGDGKLQQTWVETGVDGQKFRYLSGVAADDAGNVYLTDRLANHASKFKGDGTLVQQWGGFAPDDTYLGDFNAPTYIAIGQNGDIYITEENNKRIQRFSGDLRTADWQGAVGRVTNRGEEQEITARPILARGLAVSAEGNVFLVDNWTALPERRLQIYSADGKILREMRMPFGQVSALAINAQGQLIIATWPDGKVRVVELLRK